MQLCTCGQRGWCRETRQVAAGTRRRYECHTCHLRWNTIESRADKPSSHGSLVMTERSRLARLLAEAKEAVELAEAYLTPKRNRRASDKIGGGAG